MSVKRKVGNSLMKSKVLPLKREKLKKNAFHKFCDETSLPGWSYLNHEISLIWKMLWIIFLIAICGLSVYVLVMFIKKKS